METKLLNLPNLSLGLPDQPENEIVRDNIFPAIFSWFNSGKNIILLEGASDIGKSTFLMQFVKKNPENTFSSFVRQSISPDFVHEYVLTDLAGQIHWHLKKRELDEDKIGNEIFQRLVLKLIKTGKRKNLKFNFVLDGIENFDLESHIVKRLFADLPIGEPVFNFIISGNSNILSNLIPASYSSNVGPYPLPTFTKGEAIEYLEKHTSFNKHGKVDQPILDSIWKSCNQGSPGKLKNFVRVLEDLDCSLEDLLNDLENQSFYDLDWSLLKERDDYKLAERILAYISLDANAHTLEKISSLLGEDYDNIAKSIGATSFLQINDDDRIEFISVPHKRFFGDKLAEYSHEVNIANISYLMKNKESLESLLQLPSYFQKVEKYNEIIELLTPAYLPKVINENKSIGSINEKLLIGRGAAKALNKESHIALYSVQMSLIENIEGLHVWDSEIEARISLGDYDGATKLAQSAILKEDQLRLFARISKQRAIKKLPEDDGIKSQIERLFREVDFTSLNPDKSIEIASDLLYSEPPLAFNLIRLTSEKKSSQNVNDWAIAKLSISAYENESEEDKKIDKIKGSINDPRLQKLNRALAYLIGNYSTDKFLEELDKTEGELDKLTYISLWIGDNKHKENVYAVIDYALTTLVNVSSKKFAKTRLLSELAEALRYVENNSMRESLVERFEDFEDDAWQLGPSLEFFKFKANLIIALIDTDYLKSIRLWEDLIKKGQEEKDVITKTECNAVLNNLLAGTKDKIEKNQIYYEKSIPSALKNSIQNVLKVTADHVDSLKEVVTIIAKSDLAYAHEIANNANIQRRRDLLNYFSIQGHLTNNIEFVQLDTVENIIKRIESIDLKEGSIRRILDRFKREKSISQELNKRLLKVESLFALAYPLTRANIQVAYLQLLSQNSEINEEKIKSTLKDVQSVWENLSDDEISKIEIAYYIADDLELVDRDSAFSFMGKAEQLRKNMWVDSINSIELYNNVLRLLIIVFSGHIKNADYENTTLNSLVDQIARIPSITWKIGLYSELALLALIKEDFNLTSRILSKEIRPLYQSLTDPIIKEQVLGQISILLYKDNSASAIEEISKLRQLAKEEAISSISNFLLKNEIPNQNYADNEKSAKPDFDKVEAAIKLLNDQD